MSLKNTIMKLIVPGANVTMLSLTDRLSKNPYTNVLATDFAAVIIYMVLWSSSLPTENPSLCTQHM